MHLRAELTGGADGSEELLDQVMVPVQSNSPRGCPDWSDSWTWVTRPFAAERLCRVMKLPPSMVSEP
jgi:hypothetical protein